MEYCSGGSLDTYLRARPLSETQARKCLSQLGMLLLLLLSIYPSLLPSGFMLLFFSNICRLYLLPIYLFIYTAEALKYLDSLNIVHRDLKPQNILLSSSNIDEAVLKLCGKIYFLLAYVSLSSFGCLLVLISLLRIAHLLICIDCRFWIF